MAKRTKQDREMESAMGGASDATSGGGAGGGIPDADTVMRLGRDIGEGDIEADRAKLFPGRGPAKRAKVGGRKGMSASRKAALGGTRGGARKSAAKKSVGQGRGLAGRPSGRVQGKAGGKTRK